MKKIYMIVNMIEENKGGMTTAIFNRSRAFYDHSYPADIITFNYNLDYEQIEKNLKAVNKMDKRTKIYNMFNYFEKKSRKKRIFFQTNTEYKKLIKQMNESTRIQSTKTGSRYYSSKTGKYILFVRTEQNEIQYVDYYEQNKRHKRVYFKNDIKRLVEYFNENNKKNNEIYFNEREQPYLNITLHPKKQSVMNINLISEQKRFKSLRKFAIYFIESLLDAKDSNVLICDGPGSFPRMHGVKTKGVKKIAVIHTNHFLAPYKSGSPMKKVEKRILKHAKDIDQIIVFTEKQKQDIFNHFGASNIKVIPNFQTISKAYKKNKSDNIVGHVSRLNKNKGFDRLLQVAEIVNHRDPSIKFHLYGLGPYEDELTRKIKKMNLNEAVKLKGYTNNIKEVLKTFDISLSTSYFEAFGLSISESMEQRVPVIAMDINYGPSDLIDNEINGYLVADNDIEDMANKVIKLMHDKKRIKKFGRNARKKVLKDLNTTTLMKKWKEIL